MLAIVAPSFHLPSETFIRNHVRMIAPRATILICQDGYGTEQFDCPVLSDVDDLWLSPRSFSERVAQGIRRRWRTFVVPWLSAAKRRRLHAFLDTHRPRAVLAEYGHMGWALAGVCRDAGIPLYVYFHGHDATIFPQWSVVRSQYRQLFSMGHGVIVTTQFMKELLLELGCPEEKLLICPCGVDTRVFAPAREKKHTKQILMVSRLVAQKGPLLSVQSFIKVLARHPDAVLAIIGEGPLRAEAEAEVSRLGISENVRFHGAQPHQFVRSCLQSSQMLIQHGVTVPHGGVETLGLSILEAMACELPVVSTRHGAIVETVQHGVTGILVDEYDVDAMAAAMIEMLDCPERAAAMGAAGRQRVLEHYSLEQTCDRLRALMGLSDIETRDDAADS